MTYTMNITLTILIDTLWKIFEPLLGQNKNISSVLEEVQHMPTLQQMMTPFPPSTKLWPIMSLHIPMMMLQQANSQRLIKPCKTF